MSAEVWLSITFFALCGVGVIVALLVAPRFNPLALSIVGSLAAFNVLVLGALLLVADASFRVELWPVLTLGTLTLTEDPLSAFFLIATGLVFLPVSIFSSRYLAKYAAHYNLRYFGIGYHVLFASIVLILLAGDAISFLIAWEMMSITSYLLVNFEYERVETAQAGYVMLAMSEAGTIAVAAAFILLAGGAATLEFAEIRSAMPPLGDGIRWAIFLLSFFGFAVKAGVPVGNQIRTY
jgi:hydrogenase-4 component B